MWTLEVEKSESDSKVGSFPRPSDLVPVIQPLRASVYSSL